MKQKNNQWKMNWNYHSKLRQGGGNPSLFYFKGVYNMAKLNKKTIGQRVKELAGLTEEQIYKKTLKEYKERYLPPEYNQLELLDELTNQELDHYISITTRGDGKSFNYISAVGYICYHLNMGCLILVRHWALQDKMRELIEDIIHTVKWIDPNELKFRSNADYITMSIAGKDVFVIADLNNASDLKQSSNVLKNFPIILYDEFLALDTDYVQDEYQKMATIYKSIDRVPNRPYIKSPKIIYLGNPVNFNSPLLPALNIYNHLQTHEINTIKAYGNILLEMRRNDKRNDGKNIRAFPDPNDSDVTGEFNFTNYRLVTPDEYHKEFNHGEFIKIRIDANLMLTVLRKSDIILSIEKSDNKEDYCLNLNDETLDRVYIQDRFYSDRFVKRYKKGLFLYKDAFSKQHISEDENLQRINFLRLFKNNENTVDDAYKLVEKDMFLKRLASKYE